MKQDNIYIQHKSLKSSIAQPLLVLQPSPNRMKNFGMWVDVFINGN